MYTVSGDSKQDLLFAPSSGCPESSYKGLILSLHSFSGPTALPGLFQSSPFSFISILWKIISFKKKLPQKIRQLTAYCCYAYNIIRQPIANICEIFSCANKTRIGPLFAVSHSDLFYSSNIHSFHYPAIVYLTPTMSHCSFLQAFVTLLCHFSLTQASCLQGCGRDDRVGPQLRLDAFFFTTGQLGSIAQFICAWRVCKTPWLFCVYVTTHYFT